MVSRFGAHGRFLFRASLVGLNSGTMEARSGRAVNPKLALNPIP